MDNGDHPVVGGDNPVVLRCHYLPALITVQLG